VASLTDIREALADSLSVIPGLNQSAYLLSNPTPPCAEVQPGETEYDLAMHRGLDRWTLTVRVMVGASTDQGAQRLLDKMIESSGALSVKAAVEADSTLGGACSDCSITRCTGYRLITREGQSPLLGAEWIVEVLATG
jgi:hypothetical protein